MDKATSNHLKALIIEEGLDKEFSKAQSLIFREDNHYYMEELKAVYGDELLRVARNVNASLGRKKRRVQAKTSAFVLSGNAKFITFTFTDAVLDSTTEEQRRRYVRRFLKRQCPSYVANIDYGKTTQREHYHALVYAPSIDVKRWRYGFIKSEAVKASRNDNVAVSKYVAKLSNHALKKHCKAPSLIYSRCNYGMQKDLDAAKFLHEVIESLKSPF